MADKQSEKKPGEKKPEKKFDKKPAGATSGLETDVIGFLILVAVVLPAVTAFFSPEIRAQVIAFIATPLSYVRTIATVIAMVGVLIAVYSFIRLQEVMGRETKKLGVALSWENERTEKNSRWERVEAHMRSENPSDWKVAILEADNILDEVVERMGYSGATLGERMKAIEPSDFLYLDDAWRVHKLRNEIAHKPGIDFVLPRDVAERAIDIYHKIFKELGYL